MKMEISWKYMAQRLQWIQPWKWFVCQMVCECFWCVMRPYITLSILPEDYFHLLLYLKQPALLQFSPSFKPNSNLPLAFLSEKRKSIFRKYRRRFFFFFLNFFHLPPSLGAFLGGECLMGPVPQRDVALLHLCLSFSRPCFLLGRFVMKGRNRMGTSRFWWKGWGIWVWTKWSR